MADWPIGSLGTPVMESFGFSGTFPSLGEVVTAGAANTKGSWTELLASSSIDFSAVMLTSRLSTADADAPFLMDLAIGSAGNEEVFAENLYMSGSINRILYGWDLPVYIPSGSRVSGRVQCTVAARTVTMGCVGVGSTFASNPPSSSVKSFGANTTTTFGVTLDPGGTADVKGAWAEVEATTSDTIRGIFVSVGNNKNTATANSGNLIDIGVGSSGNEEIIIPDIQTYMNADEGIFSNNFLFQVNVPSGARLSARTQSGITDATDRKVDIVIHGVI